MRRPLKAFVSVLVMGLCAGSAGADLLWDNNIRTNGADGRPNSPPNFSNNRLVDDIVVSDDVGGWRIDRVGFNDLEDHDWVSSGILEVYVYADNAGEPGPLIGEFFGPYVRHDTGDIFGGRRDFEWKGDLSNDPINLAPGTYWIGHRDPGGSGGGSSWWMTSDGGPDGGPNGTSQTGYLSIDSGNTWEPLESRFHFAFELQGRVVPAPSALALLGLGGVIGVRRRRRSTPQSRRGESNP